MTQDRVRPAAVAGLFYPAEPAALAQMADHLLSQAAGSGLPARHLIAPHAGWIYSGAVAAAAYRRIPAGIRRVLLLAPVHRVWTPGLALPSVESFATPLGAIPLDRPALAALAGLPGAAVDDRPHRDEHAIEVHLPFLQLALADFRLIPVLVGGAPAAAVAELIAACDDGQTLVLVSSDLSHYHDQATAQRLDARTAQRILALETDLVGEEACGAAAINGLALYGRARGLAAEVLDLRNSGDTAGPPDRVVGYGSFALRAAA